MKFVANILYLSVACLVLAGVPSHAAAGKATVDSLSLKGDFTLVYRVAVTDTRSAAYRGSSQANPPQSATITLAQNGGQFLYSLTPPEEVPGSTGLYPRIVIFDGKNSFDKVLMPGSMSLMWPGFVAAECNFMPIFCSGTSSASLIRSLTPVTDGTYSADVVMPGNMFNAMAAVYDPTTNVGVENVQNQNRIKQVAWYDPAGQLSQKMTALDFAKLGNNWIPSQIAWDMSGLDNSHKVVPETHVQLVLLSSSATSDPSLFDIHKYLKKGDNITWVKVASATGPLSAASGDFLPIAYDPAKSMAQQVAEAELLRREQTLMISQGRAGRTSSGVFSLVGIVLALFAFRYWRQARKAA